MGLGEVIIVRMLPSTIQSGWDIAYHHIHLALEALGEAEAICHAATPIDVDSLSGNDCFFAAGRVETLRTMEFKKLLIVVALFQAGMEGLISYAYTKPALAGVQVPRSFVERWTTALQQLGVRHNFDAYASFYREYRNAIIHPDSGAKYEKIRSLEYAVVHAGVAAGWVAFKELAAAYGETHDQDSWSIMCTVKGVTPDLTQQGVSSLEGLARRLWLKHRSHRINQVDPAGD